MNGRRSRNPAFLLSTIRPKVRGRGEADHEQQEDLDPVGPSCSGFLERMRGVGVVETAARWCRAPLMASWLATGPAGDGLLPAGQRG